MDYIVLGEDFQPKKILDVYDSFIWIDRLSKEGKFELYTTVDIDIIKNVTNGSYIWNDNSDHTMIVEYREIITDVESGSKLKISGRSLESILDRRIILGQKNIDGNLQDELEIIINENFISPVDPNRQISNLVFERSTDPEITSLTMKSQLYGNEVLSIFNTECTKNNIGFLVSLDKDTGIFKLKLYSGSDRTDSQIDNPYITFSPEFDNLLDSNYVEAITKYKTDSMVAGSGDGSNRKTTMTTDSGLTGLNRREVFTDAADISQTTEAGDMPEAEFLEKLSQRGDENLKSLKDIKMFDGSIDANGQYRYGRDYFMGDIVEIENEFGMSAKSRITEVMRSISPSGESIIPTLEKI